MNLLFIIRHRKTLLSGYESLIILKFKNNLLNFRLWKYFKIPYTWIESIIFPFLKWIRWNYHFNSKPIEFTYINDHVNISSVTLLIWRCLLKFQKLVPGGNSYPDSCMHIRAIKVSKDSHFISWLLRLSKLMAHYWDLFRTQGVK